MEEFPKQGRFLEQFLVKFLEILGEEYLKDQKRTTTFIGKLLNSYQRNIKFSYKF